MKGVSTIQVGSKHSSELEMSSKFDNFSKIL